MLRRASIDDVQQIARLVNRFAQKGKMLPITLNSLYERIRDFTVLENKKSILACGALHIVWEDLGEIRSLAVKKRHQGKGYGREVVDYLLREAAALKLNQVFVLTLEPEVFKKYGFRKVRKERLPHKVWRDCLNCIKFPHQCDELAMVKKVKLL